MLEWLRYGKRKNGAIGLPIAFCTALKPISISARALGALSWARFWCDQVCVPTVWPRRAYSFTISGSATAMRPTTKKVAFVHCAASASSTGLV